MIYAVTGLPGSGKSLTMADRIYWGLKRSSCYIICNFELSVQSERLFYLPNDEMDVAHVREIWQHIADDMGHWPHEGQIYLCIDECQLIFNSRDWQTPGRRDWLAFFTQHRKLGFNCYLICQDLGMIDKQIRSVVEVEMSNYKVNNFGPIGSFINVLALGHPVIQTRYAATAMKSQKRGIYRREYTLGRKSLYRLYDTTNLFGQGWADGDAQARAR